MVPQAGQAGIAANAGIAAIAVAAVLCADLRAQSAGIRQAAWLEGCWKLTRGEQIVDEHWTAGVTTMTGVGHTFAAGRLVNSERVILREDGSRLAYEAHPSGQPTAVFLSVTVNPTTLIFENPAHDFPQQVGYRRNGNALTAWIEGMRNGQKRRIEFPYEPVPCEDH